MLTTRECFCRPIQPSSNMRSAMAAPAELSVERLRALPGSWSYGISQGGRVFFIK